MAKTSMKAREERRRKTVLRFAAKRAELKEIIRSPKFSQEEKEVHKSSYKNFLEMLVLLECKEGVP